MCQESESAETVVDCDDHDAVCCQLGGVVIPASALCEAAAMDPYHHGQTFPVMITMIAQLWRVEVVLQAVLFHGANCEACRLRAVRRELCGVTDTVP